MKKSVVCVVGARPNFVKMGPILQGLHVADVELATPLVHTGQHYDRAMSDQFFDDLHLPTPDVHLGVGSGSQGRQTASILEKFEQFLITAPIQPSAVLVVGDVNSTMACALAAVKLGIPVVHVEAGLRSFDRSMPEEINRIVTDAVSDLLLVSEPSGIDNLRREGHPDAQIRLVGNVMIDVLFQRLEESRRLGVPQRLGLNAGDYAVWTMHRPSNVDHPEQLARWTSSMLKIANRLPIVFPVHPRTKAKLQEGDGWRRLSADDRIRLLEPMGYLEFLGLTSGARVVITDSGGLQEETTALRIPCLTMRATTERPITVSEGTSTLVGDDADLLETLVADVIVGKYKQAPASILWDGKAGLRVGRETVDFLNSRTPRA